MRELKHQEPTIIKTHYPLRNRRKWWTIAQSRPNQEAQTMQNSAVEVAYHSVIEAVKKLYLKPSETYFERDYKTDSSEGIYGMHCIMTPHFYWRLDCEAYYDYLITYAFNNCTFETDIRTMMHGYPLDRAAIEKELKPDFNSFYEAVLSVQEERFIFTS